MDHNPYISGGDGAAGQQPIFDVVVSFFTEDNWPFTLVEGQPALRVGFQGHHGQWTCYATAREEQEQFVFYSVCPVNAPEDKLAAMAEFLTRANYGLIVGNFEMDYRDGEIRYKTSVDVEGDSLSSALIQSLVYANVTMMDRYLPGIMAVLYSDATPEEAIAEIEG